MIVTRREKAREKQRYELDRVLWRHSVAGWRRESSICFLLASRREDKGEDAHSNNKIVKNWADATRRLQIREKGKVDTIAPNRRLIKSSKASSSVSLGT